MFQAEAEQDFPCNYTSTSYWAAVQIRVQKLYFFHLLQTGSEKEEVALFKSQACKKADLPGDEEQTGTRTPEHGDRVEEEGTETFM